MKLQEIKTRTDDKGRPVVNKEQFEMVVMVARRIQTELMAEGDAAKSPGEPLRWLMHGGPGTGKSHVIQIIKEELFGKTAHCLNGEGT